MADKSMCVSFKKADSKTKEFAFRKAHELNKLENWERIECCGNNACVKCKGTGAYYKRTVWRVGKNTSEYVIIEIDESDEFNMALVKAHVEDLLKTKFNCVKTNRGYHLISKKRFKKDDWIYAHALILNPELKKEHLQDYIYLLKRVDERIKKEYKDKGLDYDFKEELKKDKLFYGVGKFDVLYTYLSIKYEKSTLRISKKHDGDKYVLIEG